MKRFLLAMLLVLGITGLAFAGVATVTATEYGYSITGGTAATSINSGKKVRVRVIAFTAANGDDVATFTSGATDVVALNIKPVASMYNATTYVYFGSEGTVFDNLEVTMTTASDVVNIYN